MRNVLPEWQLPAGVGRSLWEYAQADHIADDYDSYFAGNQLFEFDAAVLARHFVRPGRLIDLGCGTGRLLMPFARRGFACLAVDLSLPMLRVVGEKGALDHLSIDRVQANVVELDGLRSGIAEYVILMFSTLGMVRGRENRARVLAHARRLLKPQGMFVCHVHNRWQNLRDPQGRRWLARNAWESCWRRELEWGDKIYEYRGIPQMFIHVFTRGEFRRALRQAGFQIVEFLSLDTDRQRPLPYAWCGGAIRANGWIAVCTPAEVGRSPRVR